ncbi:hypothetical protein Bca4012_072810 [Brassica carinata]|uniref:Uncharacterized protein n=3 Tax=Brassica TaxID=3705 RepID=A0A8X7QIX2_BRACI|nr:hypothetical protein Bca52824_065163 [Brassica carinata]CAF1930079.1 unnamed protein product [Brassica napus]
MDTARTSGSPKKAATKRGKSVVAPFDSSQQNKRDDMNVTYRDSSGIRSDNSTVDVGIADDIIPPYDALKID